MSNLNIIISEDGSSTIYNEALQETYHSIHGAITESAHVFINHGLTTLKQKPEGISVLEVGFGTGLNALLSLQFSLRTAIKLNYHAIEPYPLPESLVAQLNYEQQLKDVKLKGCLSKLHMVSWDKYSAIADNFILYKHSKMLEQYETQLKFDIVFFDAFAPKKQPEMWNAENFSKIFEMMFHGGCLVSYCANGQFKRSLKAAGFILESLPGPPGKYEMTRAQKI